MAPATLLYTDETDTIVVFFHPQAIIVTHDGPHVVKNYWVGLENQPEVSAAFWEEVYQTILSRF